MQTLPHDFISRSPDISRTCSKAPAPPSPSPRPASPQPTATMSAFAAPTSVTVSTFTRAPAAASCARRSPRAPAPARMSATYPYSPKVDEFFARDVTRQYIAKACPTGVPPIQCIEGSTFDAPYEARTLKRQAQLRFRQLPTAVKVHNMYETRREALIACHGCSHEESRVLGNPMLAAAMVLGKAESDRACSRYMRPSGKAEEVMVKSVENYYMKAVNPGGVFSTACTDGQAKYEAYLSQVRGKAAQFRSGQYSKAAKAGAAYAARKRATARNHICLYEDGLYNRYPMMAGSIRPSFGYYCMLALMLFFPGRSHAYGPVLDDDDMWTNRCVFFLSFVLSFSLFFSSS